MTLKFPSVSIHVRWVPWETLRQRHFRRRWEKHAWESSCVLCRNYASNDVSVEAGNFPCTYGRRLLDKLYPLSAEERHAYFVSKGLK